MSSDDDEIGQALALETPEEVLTLREAADLDPLPGAPFRWGDLEIEPGEWMQAGLADRWSRLPPGVPIVPLGRTRGSSWVLDARGDIAELKDSSSGKGPIGGLFAGRSRYLEWAWPRYGKPSKGGGKGPVVGWEADDARQAIADACAFAGTYDPDRMRGRGAWTDETGGLVYHIGDRVLTGGQWEKAGRHGYWIYPARPDMGAPAVETIKGGRHGPAETLLDILQSWNWRRKEIDPHLLLGWACMAMIGGALDWRSMVFVTAEKGSGKSTLLKVMQVLFGRGMLHSVNTTGAYLYQKLGHDSIPVVVDELEAQAGQSTSKSLAIVELIRTASSGGRIGRGSSEGIARDFECRSAFICTSINIPPMRGQDQSRFAILNLDRFAKAEADPKLDWKLIEVLGRQLLRRMIDGWPRWPATLLAFKTALIETGGHDARGAEQFGALLAAAHIAESDAAPSAETLTKWATLLKSTGMAETANKTDDWRECLHHLTDVIPEGLRNKSNDRPTLGARLAAFRYSPNNLVDLEAICTMMGLAVSFPKKVPKTWEHARLFIPGSHPETRKAFAGTTWEGVPGATGVWATTLQRAPAEMIWPDVCGKGLDKKRWGLFVKLSEAFPAAAGDDDDEDAGPFA